MPNKVEAIQNIASPKTRKQLRSFIGLINYYRDMWIHRSELLAPLSRLTSNTVPCKWTPVEQEAFEKIKRSSARKPFWLSLIFPNLLLSTQMPVTPSLELSSHKTINQLLFTAESLIPRRRATPLQKENSCPLWKLLRSLETSF